MVDPESQWAVSEERFKNACIGTNGGSSGIFVPCYGWLWLRHIWGVFLWLRHIWLRHI